MQTSWELVDALRSREEEDEFPMKIVLISGHPFSPFLSLLPSSLSKGNNSRADQEHDQDQDQYQYQYQEHSQAQDIGGGIIHPPKQPIFHFKPQTSDHLHSDSSCIHSLEIIHPFSPPFLLSLKNNSYCRYTPPPLRLLPLPSPCLLNKTLIAFLFHTNDVSFMT